jgi:D-alanyl-D-alanine carboxypeptidase
MQHLGIPADYAAKRRLERQVEASYLVGVSGGAEDKEIRLDPDAAAAWEKMRAAAMGEGFVLMAISGFRSVQRQTEIIEAKLAAGESIESILRVIAAPGYSEHHTGRAIDIGVPDEPSLTEAFEMTPAFRWLGEHAGKFGFRLSYPRGNVDGIAYEPWHWRHHSALDKLTVC